MQELADAVAEGVNFSVKFVVGEGVNVDAAVTSLKKAHPKLISNINTKTLKRYVKQGNELFFTNSPFSDLVSVSINQPYNRKYPKQLVITLEGGGDGQSK